MNSEFSGVGTSFNPGRSARSFSGPFARNLSTSVCIVQCTTTRDNVCLVGVPKNMPYTTVCITHPRSVFRRSIARQPKRVPALNDTSSDSPRRDVSSADRCWHFCTIPAVEIFWHGKSAQGGVVHTVLYGTPSMTRAPRIGTTGTDV